MIRWPLPFRTPLRAFSGVKMCCSQYNGEDREMLETLFLFQRIVSEVSAWAPTKITGVAARADMDHYKTLCARHLSQILF